jgi:hypothetical protein
MQPPLPPGLPPGILLLLLSPYCARTNTETTLRGNPFCAHKAESYTCAL